jgi:hypothetical protein
MIDALTFTAPTAFSVFGVVLRCGRLSSPQASRHVPKDPAPAPATLAPCPQHGRYAPVVGGSVAHALLIEGTMGQEQQAA